MIGTALVVYESMFGNTRDVAEAVADGLRSSGRWEVLAREVGHAPTTLAGFDRLIVGAPTHALTLSGTRSRADAGRQADRPLVSDGIGVREWIERLDVADGRTVVATFDTRIRKPLLFGSAARAARRRLRGRGLRCDEAVSFWVRDIRGPLADGEVERAGAWGARFVPEPHRPVHRGNGARPSMSAD
jgi:hypothetical protein